ncbi:hypothetical protein SAMN05892883_3788 [Jatrophihabitans sp. GAS493]|uniref:RGCVC family protein n=1 Tax=Jatrophihabitans sp. GAS493 TaxID=1907575 RepID=UPI000BC02A31|nr:RGCVC family protein [Jatrophihabitans sp. GAS493]SOD74602.1 hypothetical protein SAMN05892883_3788 [Jatrophihabitans sp. GAS493]
MTSVHPSTATNVLAEATVACPVCQHSLANHDVIGQRFCKATQLNAMSRQCICRKVDHR